jgi:4-amino-4-deoxy-L-arabinose transferase-like glycosyltransferase
MTAVAGQRQTGGVLQGFRSVVACGFSREAVPYWTMFSIALAIRIAHQIIMSRNDPMYGFLMSGGDNHTYDRWALEISQTFWLGWDRIPFLHGPLYPYFLGLIYLRFGYSFDAAAWSQRFLGALTVVLIFYMARRIFGKKAGWCAGVGATFCPLFLMYEGEVLVETLVVFVNTVALCVLVTAASKKQMCWWLFSGVCIGICCLGRPNVLLLIPFVACWIAIIAPGSLRGKVVAAIVFLAAALLTISPATLLNYFVGHRLFLVTHSASVNLYIGNAPDSIGLYCTPPSMRTILDAEQKPEMDINWKGYLLKAWYDDPTVLPRQLWVKTKLYWQSGELPAETNFYLKQAFSPLLRLPFRWAVVAPLGVVGMCLAFAFKRPKTLSDARVVLFAYFVLYSLSMILVFVPDRHRLPALVILFVFAGYAFALLLDAFRDILISRKAARASVALAIGVLVAWGALGVALKTRDESRLIRWNDYLNLGSAYESKEMYEEALVQYEKALACAPENKALQEITNNTRKTVQQIRERGV